MTNVLRYVAHSMQQEIDISELGLPGVIRKLREIARPSFGSEAKNAAQYDLPIVHVRYPVTEEAVSELMLKYLPELGAKLPEAADMFAYLPIIKEKIEELTWFQADLTLKEQLEIANEYKEEIARAKELFCVMCNICLKADKEVQIREGETDLVKPKDTKLVVEETKVILDRLITIKAYEEALEFMEIGYKALLHFEAEYLDLFSKLQKRGELPDGVVDFTDFRTKTPEGQEYEKIRASVVELEAKSLELRRLTSRGVVVKGARELSLGKACFSEDPNVGIGIYNLEDYSVVLLRCKRDIKTDEQVTTKRGAKAAFFVSTGSSPKDNIFLDQQLDGLLESFKSKHPGMTNDDIEVTIIGGKTSIPKGLDNLKALCVVTNETVDKITNDLSQIARYEGNNFGGHIRKLNQLISDIQAGIRYAEIYGFYDFSELQTSMESELKALCPKLQVHQTQDRVNLDSEIVTKHREISVGLQKNFKELQAITSRIPVDPDKVSSLVGNGAVLLNEIVSFVTRHNLVLGSACVAKSNMPDNFVFTENEKGLSVIRGEAEHKRENWRAARIHGMMWLDGGLCNIEFDSSTAPFNPLFIARTRSAYTYEALLSHPLEFARMIINLGGRYSDLPEFNAGLTDLGNALLGIHSGYFRFKASADNSVLGLRVRTLIGEIIKNRKEAAGVFTLPEELQSDLRVNIDDLLGPTLIKGIQGKETVDLSFCLFLDGNNTGQEHAERTIKLNLPIASCLLSDKPGQAFIVPSFGIPQKVTITIEAPKVAEPSRLDLALSKGPQPPAFATFKPSNPTDLKSILGGNAGGLTSKPVLSGSSGSAPTGLGIDFKAIAAAAKSPEPTRPTSPPKQEGPKRKTVTIRPLTLRSDHNALNMAFRMVEESALQWSLTPDIGKTPNFRANLTGNGLHGK